MSNENLIKTLVETIMKDERFVALLQNTKSAQAVSGDKTLYLIEESTDCSLIPGFPAQSVFCQEHQEGAQGYLSCQQIDVAGFSQLVLVNPSYNLICKLAMGIADEPIAMILQKRMAMMDGQLSISSMKHVEEIRNPVFGQYIQKQLGVMQSFGFHVGKTAMKAPTGMPPVVPMLKQEPPIQPEGNLLWSKRALTEKDMLGIEKNGAITVAAKCIVTSLASDMARRRGIKIYREGETQ